MSQNSELDLKCLCQNIVVLFLILRARRNQALMTITVKNVILQNDKLILIQSKTLKYSTPNRPLKPFAYHRYQANEKLCIVNCLQFYLREQNSIVNPS